jgi:putative ABC transport system permease protein
VFWKFILRALKYRKQRLLLAFAALTVAAAMATVLFGTYGSVESRLREEFRSYGANISAVGPQVPIAVAAAAEHLGAETAPFLVSPPNIVAFDPGKSRSLTGFWHVEGTRDIRPGECLAGELLKLPIGSKTADCTVKGIVSTGGAEDQELLVPLTPGTPVVSYIEIRAPGDRIDSIRTALAEQFPKVEFRTIRAVADTETNVVLKIRASLLLLTLLILAITTLCVSGNFTEMVIERAKEIAILKALGGAERRIATFFVSESAALAIASTFAGYIAGIIAAAFIGQQIFGGAFHLQASWLVFGGVTLVMLIVAAVATAIAASRIWSIEPAIILRGE